MILNAIKLDFSFDVSLYQELLKFVTEDRKTQLHKFVRYEDKIRGLFAELLLRKLLEINYSLRWSELSFTKNKYGKPSLNEYQNVHFNIAHSGDWVVCGVDNLPLGVDVEYMKTAHPDIAERFFTKEECEQIFSLPEKDQTTQFYRFWTLKESYIKCVGMGLSLPLDSFLFSINKEISLSIKGRIVSEYKHHLFYPDQNHIISISSQNKYENPNLIIGTQAKIMKYFNA